MQLQKNLPPLRSNEQRLSYEDNSNVAVVKSGINPWVILFVIVILVFLIWMINGSQREN